MNLHEEKISSSKSVSILLFLLKFFVDVPEISWKKILKNYLDLKKIDS